MIDLWYNTMEIFWSVDQFGIQQSRDTVKVKIVHKSASWTESDDSKIVPLKEEIQEVQDLLKKIKDSLIQILTNKQEKLQKTMASLAGNLDEVKLLL